MAVDFTKLNTDVDAMLSLIPEEHREKARAQYSRIQDAARELVDKHRQVVTTANEQSVWWRDHQNDVAELAELRRKTGQSGQSNGNGNGNGDGNAITQAVLDAALAKQRDEILGTGLGLITANGTISAQHLHEFGEVLDLRKLTQDAMAANTPLDQFYAESVAARRKERDDKARAAELAKAREEGKAEGLKEGLARTGQGMPYPVGVSAPTTLSGLRKPAEGQPNPYGLEAAIATANEVLARSNAT